MKVRIGSCSGPLDATLVRSYFALHEIAITVTSWLDIEAEARDEVRARACLRKLRAPGNSLDTELDASGHFEHHDDDDELETPPARTAPFAVERHQAPIESIKAGKPELIFRALRRRN